MRSRPEIVWHGFLYSIYDGHVEILVRVGKLVGLRMGKVGDLGDLFWYDCLDQPANSTAIAGRSLG